MAFAKGLAFSLLWLPMAWGAKTLKPQDVVDTVLKQGLETELISLDAQKNFALMEKALGVYDFGFSGKTTYEYDEAESLSGLSNPIDKTLLAEMALEKKTGFGAGLKLGYLHQTQSSVLNAIVTNSRDPDLTLDSVFFEWRQSLWGNFFGLGDKAELSMARRTFQASDMAKQEETENLVLKSLDHFWRAYVAKTRLKDALTARQMYKDLVKVVQRRGRFGLDRGGEYAEVMAEYTDAESAVKTASYDYLERLRSLETLMQEKIDEDLEFEVPELIPPLPRLEAVDIDQLRRAKLSRVELDNAMDNERSVHWKNRTTVDMVARAASTGVDTRASAAYSELASGTKPTYFVGLEVKADLDSAKSRAAEAEARVSRMQSEIRFRQNRQQMEADFFLLERRLEEAYLNAKNSVEGEKFRLKTVREREAEYKQGRIPLRELLNTYNKYFDSQTRRVSAIGDYHMALNRMAALRDELVR